MFGFLKSTFSNLSVVDLKKTLYVFGLSDPTAVEGGAVFATGIVAGAVLFPNLDFSPFLYSPSIVLSITKSYYPGPGPFFPSKTPFSNLFELVPKAPSLIP